MNTDELVEVKKQLARLNATLKRVNSFKVSFARGIVYGIGATIGATIIAAIGITIGLKILQAVGVESLLPRDTINNQAR